MSIGKQEIYFFNQFVKKLVTAQRSNVPVVKYCPRNFSQKSVTKLAAILRQRRLIHSYFVDSDVIGVCLHQFHHIGRPFTVAQNISTIARMVSVSVEQLKSWKLVYPTSCYIISTPLGLMDDLQAIKENTGGFLILRIGF